MFLFGTENRPSCQIMLFICFSFTGRRTISASLVLLFSEAADVISREQVLRAQVVAGTQHKDLARFQKSAET